MQLSSTWQSGRILLAAKLPRAKYKCLQIFIRIQHTEVSEECLVVDIADAVSEWLEIRVLEVPLFRCVVLEDFQAVADSLLEIHHAGIDNIETNVWLNLYIVINTLPSSSYPLSDLGKVGTTRFLLPL